MFTPTPVTCPTLKSECQRGFFAIGAAFGLGLTLNVEQYEYIRSPSIDAGIKVKAISPIDSQ